MKFNVQINILDATEDEIRAYFNRSTSAAALSALVHATSTVMPANGATAATTDDDGDGSINTHAPAVDSAGIPWDDRIHSRNKGLNADQTWRKKRGVDGAMVAAVEAELKMRTPQFQPPAQQQPTFTQPSAQVQMPPNPGYQPPPVQYQAPPPNGYAPPPAQQHYQPPQPSQLDFSGFMQHLTAQMGKRDQHGQPLITTDYLANVCGRLSAQFGRLFNSITDIATDLGAINFAVSLITADGRWN